jgi:hypothetical protein
VVIEDQSYKAGYLFTLQIVLNLVLLAVFLAGFVGSPYRIWSHARFASQEKYDRANRITFKHRTPGSPVLKNLAISPLIRSTDTFPLPSELPLIPPHPFLDRQVSQTLSDGREIVENIGSRFPGISDNRAIAGRIDF